MCISYNPNKPNYMYAHFHNYYHPYRFYQHSFNLIALPFLFFRNWTLRTFNCSLTSSPPLPLRTAACTHPRSPPRPRPGAASTTARPWLPPRSSTRTRRHWERSWEWPSRGRLIKGRTMWWNCPIRYACVFRSVLRVIYGVKYIMKKMAWPSILNELT